MPSTALGPSGPVKLMSAVADIAMSLPVHMGDFGGQVLAVEIIPGSLRTKLSATATATREIGLPLTNLVNLPATLPAQKYGSGSRCLRILENDITIFGHHGVRRAHNLGDDVPFAPGGEDESSLLQLNRLRCESLPVPHEIFRSLLHIVTDRAIIGAEIFQYLVIRLAPCVIEGSPVVFDERDCTLPVLLLRGSRELWLHGHLGGGGGRRGRGGA